MTNVKVGINGFGRIGRTLLREYYRQKAAGHKFCYDIVAVNNPGSIETYAHLLEFDSVHKHFALSASVEGSNFIVQGQKIAFLQHRNPTEIPWSAYGVQMVIDCTGIFKDLEGLSQHLNSTVKKVIMCAPGKKLHGTFVYGINHESYNPEKHHVISNASCTTNCLAPVAKVLDENFEIVNGFMTTVHAYTSDQNLLDNSHSDLRRARAAAMSMIPTTTGAAKALGEVLPNLVGKLDGYAVRVPTPDVSMVDLTVTLKKPISKESINNVMKVASETSLKSIFSYTTKELVSIDFMGSPYSSIFDSKLTNTIGQTAKVVAWYDNEVGFSNRVLDLANYVGIKSWH
jgi:glyceraldehyde 3-phosphate dehydrogenase